MTVQEHRAYVDQRWSGVELHDTGMTDAGMFYVSIAGFGSAPWRGKTEAEAIAAAYAFTVAREEEISELGEEVEQMADHAHMALERVRDLINDGDDGESLVIYVRDVCEYTRTWVRLTAILEEKRKGWKL